MLGEVLMAPALGPDVVALEAEVRPLAPRDDVTRGGRRVAVPPVRDDPGLAHVCGVLEHLEAEPCPGGATVELELVGTAAETTGSGDNWHDEDFVFATNDGRPVEWRALDRAFVRAQMRAGVRRQRFHDMRHAIATLLLGAGEEIAVISNMLGHADNSTTVEVYSHLSTERSRVAAARIDVLLKHRQTPDEIAI